MYSRDLIEAVLHSADVVTVISSYINVEKKGRSYVAVCPFHNDKNPSLNISKEKQIYKCFSCGEGGNAITFVQRFERIPYGQAVRKTAEIVGFSDPRLVEDMPRIRVDESKQKLYDCINDLNEFYQYGLSVAEGAKAREYLDSRNIDETQRKKYGIGYSLQNGEMTVRYLQKKGHSLKSIEDIGIAIARSEGTSDSNAGRITFPIYDPNGQVVGFSARRLDSVHDRKYVNSPEGPLFHKGSVLYNYHNVIASAKREGYCYVLEGFMDVMALERAGLPNAVALMGTALTPEQVNLLKKLRCELRLCLDGDEAGQVGMMRMCSLLSKAGVPFRFVDYGDDLRDPDDILQSEGPEALKAKMETLIEPIDFQLSFYTKTKKVESSEDRKRVLASFLPYVRSIPAGIEQENYLVKLSKATGYEVEAIRTLLAQLPDEESVSERTIYREISSLETTHPERALTKRLGIAEKTILYYMLHEPEAVEFFKTNVKDFSTNAYEVIAMSILEYARLHPGTLQIDGLLSLMQEKEDEESVSAVETATALAFEERNEPYSVDLLYSCLKTIDEEKRALHDEATAKAAMNGSSSRDAAKAIAELAKKKGQKWPKK